MKPFGIFAFAVLLSSGTAEPAFASWDRVGSVGFSVADTYESEYRNFAGDALSFKADNANFSCQSVTAIFGDGRSRLVFRGELPRGQDVAVGLPEHQGNVTRLDFNCHPDGNWGGRVEISAGSGEHVATEWQIPQWQVLLARLR